MGMHPEQSNADMREERLRKAELDREEEAAWYLGQVIRASC